VLLVFKVDKEFKVLKDLKALKALHQPAQQD
jgi:hypothetical protein